VRNRKGEVCSGRAYFPVNAEPYSDATLAALVKRVRQGLLDETEMGEILPTPPLDPEQSCTGETIEQIRKRWDLAQLVPGMGSTPGNYAKDLHVLLEEMERVWSALGIHHDMFEVTTAEDGTTLTERKVEASPSMSVRVLVATLGAEGDRCRELEHDLEKVRHALGVHGYESRLAGEDDEEEIRVQLPLETAVQNLVRNLEFADNEVRILKASLNATFPHRL
jgi:hypothetical protein